MARGERLLLHLNNERKVVTVRTNFNGIPVDEQGAELANGAELLLDPLLVDPTGDSDFGTAPKITGLLQFRSSLLTIEQNGGYGAIRFFWYNGRASSYEVEEGSFHKEHRSRLAGFVGTSGQSFGRGGMCYWPAIDEEADRLIVLNSGGDTGGNVIQVDPDDELTPTSTTIKSPTAILGDDARIGFYASGFSDAISVGRSSSPPHSDEFAVVFKDLLGNLLCEPFTTPGAFLTLVPPEMDCPSQEVLLGRGLNRRPYLPVKLTEYGQWHSSWASGAKVEVTRKSGTTRPLVTPPGVGPHNIQVLDKSPTTTIHFLSPTFIPPAYTSTFFSKIVPPHNFVSCDIGPDDYLWVLDYGAPGYTSHQVNLGEIPAPPAGQQPGPGQYDGILPTPIWRFSSPIKVHAVRRADFRIVKSVTLSAGGGPCWSMSIGSKMVEDVHHYLSDSLEAFYAGDLRFDADGNMWVMLLKRNNRSGEFPGENVPYSQPDYEYIGNVPDPFNAVVPIIGIVNLQTGQLNRWWVAPIVAAKGLTPVAGLAWFNKRGRRAGGANGAIEPVKRRPVGLGGKDEDGQDHADCACKDAVELKYPPPSEPRRTFSSKFLTAASKRHSSPYFVLMVEWKFGGTKCYSDRRPGDFESSGRHLPIGCETNVHSWGDIGTQLAEGQIGTFDRTEVTIHDQDGSLRRLLSFGVQQSSTARIWLAFDSPGYTWLDAVEVFSGRLMGNNRWSEASGAVTLELEMDVIQKTVGKQATRKAFHLVHPEHEDKPLPIAWGCARRVEAVCVRKPWETRILTTIVQFAGSGLPEQVVLDLLDHPEDIGAPVDKLISAYIGPHEVRGIFRQSEDTANTPSTFECNVLEGGLIVAKATILYMRPSRYGAARAVPVLALNTLRPSNIDLRLMTTHGQKVNVFTGGAWLSFTLGNIEYNFPHDNCCTLQLVGDTSGLSAGDLVVFPDPDADRVNWLAGMPIRERGGKWKYLCNMLPSGGVALVEGFGTSRNELGVTGKDFIPLGRIKDVPLDQYGDRLPDFNLDMPSWTQKASDAEWADQLGHNVTTISFDQAPHTLFPELSSNRLWVTLTGTVGGNGKPITNPAYVLYEYLTSPHLMALTGNQVDAVSFADAAFCLEDFRVGFAQVDVQAAIPYVQDIARQCHCVLQWSADGKLRCVVLRNDPTTPGMAFDPDQIAQRSLEFGESRLEDLVSTVVGDWRRNWDDITGQNLEHVILVNRRVEELVPKRVQRFPIWIYSCRQQVEAELTHWLNRWSRILRTARFVAPLDAVCLRPGDSVVTEFTDGEENDVIPANQGAIVRGTQVRPDGVVLSLEWIAHDRR